MVNLNWLENKDSVISTLNIYFGLPYEQILKLINENYPIYRRNGYITNNSLRNRQNLVAMVNALIPYCKAGQPAYVDGIPQKNIVDRMKSGEAILKNPYFADENPVHIYHRLRHLYREISSAGIDIYKTIYIGSLTKGNSGILHDCETGEILNYSNFDKDFGKIYGELMKVLRLSKADANLLVEKCPATILSKVSASNITAIYQTMMNLKLTNEEEHFYSYIFRNDKEFEGQKRSEQKSKVLDNGLINCPTIFSCTPQNIVDAFNYISRKIPAELIEKEYMKFKLAGNTTMTRFWCKHQTLRKWINNNFSLLTINDKKMYYKESILHEVAVALNDRVYHGGKDTSYSFKFLFDNPVSISTMNSIPDEQLDANAKKNIMTLEKYTSEEGVVDYIKKNHYVLAMDNNKLNSLLEKIAEHDAKNPEDLCMQRFFTIGKSLFGSKHSINFDVEPTYKRLAKIESVQILNVDEMDDWTRVSLFVGIFCGGDQTFFNSIQRLYHEKLLKENRGNGELRKEIRTLLIKNGGWDEILKDKKKVGAITTEVKSITDKRFAVEQLSRTENLTEDIAALQAKEDAFSNAIKGVLNRIRNSYTANRDKLTKRFTDIDKLYELTIEFLTEKCFDDKEPISVLIDEELRKPYVESLKKMETTNINPQQSLFGAETVEVSAPKEMYIPIKKLTEELSRDAYYKIESDVVSVSRSKNNGEGK